MVDKSLGCVRELVTKLAASAVWEPLKKMLESPEALGAAVATAGVASGRETADADAILAFDFVVTFGMIMASIWIVQTELRSGRTIVLPLTRAETPVGFWLIVGVQIAGGAMGVVCLLGIGYLMATMKQN